MNLTHAFIQLMGGKVAPTKSRILTNDKAAAEWLDGYHWPHVKQCIKTCRHTRDLGAHLFIGAWSKDNTLTQRMCDTMPILRNFERIPTSFPRKAAVVRGKGHPKALYGCEGVDLDDDTLRKYRTCVLDVVTPKGNSRSANLAFTTSSYGPDLDPECVICVRRAMALRRAFAKRPYLRLAAQRIYVMYVGLKYHGIMLQDTDISKLQPAPPARRSGKRKLDA